MNVEIKDSVREAGLEEAVRKASQLFPKVVARSLQHLLRVTWEVLTDAYGSKWVLLALEFEGQVTEREVFEPASLGDTEFMRERFEWLWGRVLRASLKKQVDAPPGEVVVVEPVIHLPNG